MASTFKTLLADDVVSTRTLLHEAIPITGTIVSGTYVNKAGTESNIKSFSHGMFQSVYDYPYLSSSANHIFDITHGHSNELSSSSDWMTQNSKKFNVYNQMAQVLMGYDESGSIKKFSADGRGDYDTRPWSTMHNCIFMNFSRLLVKDEIKKGSMKLTLYRGGQIKSGSMTSMFGGDADDVVVSDYQSSTEYRTSPAGDYGILYTSSAGAATTNAVDAMTSAGLIFYQAGVVVLTASLFHGQFGPMVSGSNYAGGAIAGHPHISAEGSTSGSLMATRSGSISDIADGLRMRIDNISFNNTIELNSSIYFCRVNHNEFNYSSNPTYLTGSKIRVKNNSTDLPVTYITTVGLYSADNELLAVAKLSEPIRKDPNTELTLRVRLDY